MKIFRDGGMSYGRVLVFIRIVNEQYLTWLCDPTAPPPSSTWVPPHCAWAHTPAQKQVRV